MPTRQTTLTNILQNLDLTPKVGRPASVYLQVPGAGKATDLEGGVLFNGQQFGLSAVTNSSGVYAIPGVAYMGDLSPAGCQLVVLEDGQQVLSPLNYAYASSITVSSWYPNPVTAGTLTMLVNLEKLNITPSQGQGVRFAISSTATFGTIKINASDSVVIASDVSGNVTINLVPTLNLTPNTTVYSATYPDGSVDYFTVPTTPTGLLGAYNAGTTYNAHAGTFVSPADVVTFGGLYYQYINATPAAGHQPDISPTYWQLLPGEPIEWHLTAVSVPGVMAIGAANVTASGTLPGALIGSPASVQDVLSNLLFVDEFGNLETRTVTTNDTADHTDDVILVDATASNLVETIPTAIGQTKYLVVVKKDSSAHTVTLTGAVGGQLTSYIITTQNTGALLISDNAVWYAVPIGATGGGGSTVMGASGVSHAAGLAPDPGASAGTTHYLREDATWALPASASVMVASGASHAAGLAPDPGASAATTHFLREDATWAIPPTGTLAVQWLTKSANYTALTTDTNILVDASGGPVTITVPTAVGGFWRITVKKKDSSGNAVNVATTGGQTIDGNASPLVLLGQNQSETLVGDGANAYIE